jgi:hypothetical protein
MGLERLINRESPREISYATVFHVDPGNRRVKIRVLTGIETFADYVPSDFLGLEEGHTVAIGTAAGEAFLISAVSSTLPSEITLPEV